jgi:hypothetical protein
MHAMTTITKKFHSLGGKAVINKSAPEKCPRCDASMQGRCWHSYLGHLGLHGLADKYFGGNIEAAQKRLQRNGLARQDPFKGNGAWKPYVPVQEVSKVPDVKLRWEDVGEVSF